MTVETLTENLKTAKGAAGELGAPALGAIKSEAASLADAAGEGLRAEAKIQLGAGKDGIVDQGERLTYALQRTASQTESEIERRVLRALAAGVDELTQDLRSRNVESLIADARAFARTHPAAFIAGAALAGFAAARFARATSAGDSAPSHGDAHFAAPSGDMTGATSVPQGHAFDFAARASVKETPEPLR